jgi:eukaryotic-like serine/threonine-protein kinase
MTGRPVSSAPTVIHRYQIVDRIGQGGMGALYLARDPLLDRLVAIKVLREGFDNDELRERFAREARSAARLAHVNIVAIFDFGEHEGQPFIAMEYIPGETLAEKIRRKAALSTVQRLRYVEELCAGLGHAHKAQIVHRDVKPANVMISPDGLVKILDFGIARLADSSMTQAGMIVGTLNYMSPEQVAGGAIDHRSDVFALGAVFYEILAYRQAFPGSLRDGILHRILNAPPEALAGLRPDLDPAIAAIVMRALEKDPGARYQNLSTMRRDVARIRERLEREDPQQGETLIVRADDETIAIEAPRPSTGGLGSGTGSGSGETPRTPSASGRRGADPREIAQRRAAEIAARLEAASGAFDRGDFSTAIAAAEAVLLLAPEHEDALRLIDRAHEAQDAAALAGAIAAARAALGEGALDRASELVDKAAAIDSGHVDVAAFRAELDAARQRAAEERRRAAAIAEAMARAERSLADGAHESAIRAASEALALDPALEAAQAVRRRAAEAIAAEAARQRQEEEARRRAEEEARRAEAERQRLAEAARLAEEARQREEAARRRADEERREREAEQARIAEEERKAREEERQAREEEARLAEEARRQREEEERRQREAEQARIAEEERKAREEERRRREEEERIAREEAERAAAAHLAAAEAAVGDAEAAFEQGRHGEALALLERFAPPHEHTSAALRGLKTKLAGIERARREQQEKERRAEARRRREEEERLAAAERERQARQHLQEAAAAVEAGLAREALAAIARARAIDAAADAGDIEARAVAIVEEEKRLEAERRRQARAERIAAVKGLAGSRGVQIAAGVVVIVGLLAVVVPRLGPGETPAPDADMQQAALDAAPQEPDGVTPPAAAPAPEAESGPSPEPASPPRTEPDAPTPRPADPGPAPRPSDPPPATAKAVDTPDARAKEPAPPAARPAVNLSQAETLYKQGRRDQALKALLAVDKGLDDPRSHNLLDSWIRDAVGRVTTVAAQAVTAGVPMTAPEFQRANDQRGVAEALGRQGQRAEALEAYWRAAAMYEALEPPAPGAKPADPETPSPAAKPAAPTGLSADQEAVLGVIAAYQAAMNKRDVQAASQARRLDSTLRRQIDGLRNSQKYSYSLRSAQSPDVSGNRATVVATERQVGVDPTGRPFELDRNVTVRLEKTRDAWLITAIDAR